MPQTYRRLCPHCLQEVAWPETPTYPFCSERCRLIDLGAWASGDYRIPGEPVTDEEEGVGGAASENDMQAEWGEEYA